MKDGTVPADTGALLGLKVPQPSGVFQRAAAGGFLMVPVLQVVGGKMTESGRLCAFITKVKRGSLADTVGHLRPGELRVPGCSLQDAGVQPQTFSLAFLRGPGPGVERPSSPRSDF